jgi:hypothetical protein
MSNEKNISQKIVSTFLLGLGIGLVVGIVFNPQPDNYTSGFRESVVGRNASPSAPTNAER